MCFFIPKLYIVYFILTHYIFHGLITLHVLHECIWLVVICHVGELRDKISKVNQSTQIVFHKPQMKMYFCRWPSIKRMLFFFSIILALRSEFLVESHPGDLDHCFEELEKKHDFVMHSFVLLELLDTWLSNDSLMALMALVPFSISQGW